ncbi:antitoxin VbhA family protein [Neptunomonas japonica]|uniref:antitoxin VbhA family protein n=1 Tax=Neptunomonas japonica TaxID=417574 RepID=UPI00048D0D7A|nr:antitoxin VbhA family protein [Neptunomonas japonica]
MKISVYIYLAPHSEPLVRDIDVLVQMKWLDLDNYWLQFISSEIHIYMPNGNQYIRLCDLECFCSQNKIKLDILKGLDAQKSRAFAIANCRLSGLNLSALTLELLDRVKVGELSTNEAINILLSKSKQ